jgi:plasmid stabilization system protein ParE
MPYTVLLLEDAVKDIEAVYRHYRRSGSAEVVKDMVSSLRKACSSLTSHPERGHIPPELSRIPHFEYRQIIQNKFKIIYQVAEPHVFVFGIIHGAQNIGEVLKQRLLR